MNSTLGSSDIAWLLSHRDQILEGIRRSSPLSAFNPVVVTAFMAEALDKSEKEILRAEQCRAKRTATIEAGIRKAVGILPIDRHTAGIVKRRITIKPARYGLNRVPDPEKIRDVLKQLKAGSNTEPALDCCGVGQNHQNTRYAFTTLQSTRGSS